MLAEDIRILVQNALLESQKAGKLPTVTIDDYGIERPQDPQHGDYATGLPMKMARTARMNPMEIAKILVGFIPDQDEISNVNVAPPGFINFTLSAEWLRDQIQNILVQGMDFGNSTIGQGQKVQIEYVSVNPTGPIHVGHGRVAVIGSALAMALDAAGFNVQREYYVNDGGNQMELFNSSLWARYQQELDVPAEMPENGYIGEYVSELARDLIEAHGQKFLDLPGDQASKELGKIGMDKALDQIKRDLERLNVTFDEWFSELSLFSDNTYDTSMNTLREQGYVMEKEGALWFESTALGDDRDNVLVRSSGVPTYFAADMAYHYNKFGIRKFDRVIDVWGADHQGHVPRMKAAVEALGYDPEKLDVITVQLVTLKRSEELLRLSKRRGEIITLSELLDDVGPDACRYFFLIRSANTQMEFDLDLAKKEAPDNPVFYIQYAHARIASIQRTADEGNLSSEGAKLSLLVEPIELSLIRKMLQLPEVINTVAVTLSPHSLAHYAQELATLFHDFYTQCRVITDDRELTASRLLLVEATRLVLAKTLSLMGMTIPDRM
ncbi:MAG: arginine--tRNA ligase [SAR202 cluster bacterium]|nr:arginine--tRNA ligase [SAR202 cluster bacterium]|tara:strand:+ start:793 stop:2451 length:1659 start_codon:yes stop_codon:yes gene_type:complete